jgi:hypothetical protein
MNSSIIELLENDSPENRVHIIQNLYTKNRRYLAEKHPVIEKAIKELGESPYQLQLTHDFIEIINVKDRTNCYPQIPLNTFARALGDWTHNGWIELLDPKPRNYALKTWHRSTHLKYIDELRQILPVFADRIKQGSINLPTISEDQRFANCSIFVGIFHGLHIAHYLARTEINHIAFIEPDPYRFEVSCYFLDYAALDDKKKGLLIHVGKNTPDSLIDSIFRKAFVTGRVWTRVLPGYASESLEPIIQKLRLKWLTLNDTWVPADRELNALKNGALNLENDHHLLVKRPKLSRVARIAVIGAGPSLSNDISWLEQNQENLIIFASHTSVRVLQDNDITPDFQFSLDLDWDQSVKEKLHLDPEIPFIVPFQINPKVASDFKHVYMVAGETIATPVKLLYYLPFMYPTTGNMVFALALFCQPQEIYLLGMDLGFHSAEHIHVTGSHFDHESSNLELVKGREQIPVSPNFKNRNIISRPYFCQARHVIEKALFNTHVKVFNLSDGAYIQGTTPKSSSRVSLPRYLVKKTDITAIISSFQLSYDGIHWNSYTKSGNASLEKFKQLCNESLTLPTFSYKTFSTSIDTCQFFINEALKDGKNHDSRMIPYLRVLRDFLTSWYCFMVLTQTAEEAHVIYKQGFTSLFNLINDFEYLSSVEDR